MEGKREAERGERVQRGRQRWTVNKEETKRTSEHTGKESYELLSTFLLHPPFLQTQTIATLCRCERAGGHCLCFPQAGSGGFLWAAPSQQAAKEEEVQSNQSPRMYQPLICFQDDPLEFTLPLLHTFSAVLVLLLSLFTVPSCVLLFFSFPLILPSVPLPTISLPALSVMQLVVLKVWSVGRLVGEAGGGGGVPLGACAVPQNMVRFPHKHTKGSSLIKTLCFSSSHAPNTHRPGFQ